MKAATILFALTLLLGSVAQADELPAMEALRHELRTTRIATGFGLVVLGVGTTIYGVAGVNASQHSDGEQSVQNRDLVIASAGLLATLTGLYFLNPSPGKKHDSVF